MTAISVIVRRMLEADLPEVMRIDASSQRRPWTREQFRGMMVVPDTCCRVAVRHKRIVGVVIFARYREGMCVTKLSVLSEWRRHRIGTQLMDCAIRHMDDERDECYIAVPERNVIGQQFLRFNGFTATVVKPEVHGLNTDDDVYLFSRGRKG